MMKITLAYGVLAMSASHWVSGHWYGSIASSDSNSNANYQASLATFSFDEPRKFIEELVRDWAATNAMQIEYENVKDSNALRTAKKTGKHWLRISIREGLSNQIELGNQGLSRMNGVFIISCFATKNEGTKLLRDKVSSLSSHIYSKRATFKGNLASPAPAIAGIEADWVMINLTVPFAYDYSY